jgi:hypothetical protein
MGCGKPLPPAIELGRNIKFPLSTLRAQPMTDTVQQSRAATRWLISILLAITLEGGLRKWILPPWLHPVAYASKDILALAFVIHHSRLSSKILADLRDRVLLITLLLLPCFLLGLTWSPMAAVMNFKNAVLWPLFAIYMAVSFDWSALSKVTRALNVLVFAMAILGFIQFNSPIDAAINRYAWHVMGRMEPIATFGASAGVRATGTFSYISGYSTFASFTFLWMVWRLLNAQTFAERALSSLGAVSGLVCALTSGSRSPLYQCFLGLVMAIAVSSQIRRKLRILALAGVIIASYFTFSNEQLFLSFCQRFTEAGDSTSQRIAGGGLEFVRLALQHPFGVGMGQESNVRDYRVAEQQAAIDFIEDGRSRMAIEGGWLAILAQMVTFGIFISIAIRAWRTQDDQARIAAAVMLPAATYLLTNCLWYDHNASALWWFFIGAWLGVTLRAAETSVRPKLPTTFPSYAAGSPQSSVWQSEFV